MKKSAFQRRLRNLGNRGVLSFFARSIVIGADALFDIRYGTETSSSCKLEDLTIDSDNIDRGRVYQPTRWVPLQCLFKKIASIIPQNSVFVDFGSGKGRVLMIASQFGFAELHGVEFSQELNQIARDNLEILKKRTRSDFKFSIFLEDAANYSIRDNENVFFLFNPFDEIVMASIVKNICDSLDRHPRKIFIIYYIPLHSHVIERHPIISKFVDLEIWSYNFRIYSNVWFSQSHL